LPPKFPIDYFKGAKPIPGNGKKSHESLLKGTIVIIKNGIIRKGYIYGYKKT